MEKVSPRKRVDEGLGIVVEISCFVDEPPLIPEDVLVGRLAGQQNGHLSVGPAKLGLRHNLPIPSQFVGGHVRRGHLGLTKRLKKLLDVIQGILKHLLPDLFVEPVRGARLGGIARSKALSDEFFISPERLFIGGDRVGLGEELEEVIEAQEPVPGRLKRFSLPLVRVVKVQCNRHLL